MTKGKFSVVKEALPNPAFFSLVANIGSALKGCRTVLDLGCGNNSPLRFLNTAQVVGVDGYPPVIEEAHKRRTHDEYFISDVKQIRSLFPERRFEGCIALDVIEHLEKEDGWQMLDNMEELATKRVVIFTPNGFLPQKGHAGDLQEHQSGWTADEFRQRGYRVIGMHGHKSLRVEYHNLRYRPKVFWALVSMLTHWLYTRSHPEKSAALLAIKEVGRALE